MSRINALLKSSGPTSKLLMAISITSALVLFHRLVYAPHVRNTRYRQAEEWANKIIEQEEMAENNGFSSGSNNISY